MFFVIVESGRVKIDSYIERESYEKILLWRKINLVDFYDKLMIFIFVYCDC